MMTNYPDEAVVSTCDTLTRLRAVLGIGPDVDIVAHVEQTWTRDATVTYFRERCQRLEAERAQVQAHLAAAIQDRDRAVATLARVQDVINVAGRRW
jgi:hypothetical protein